MSPLRSDDQLRADASSFMSRLLLTGFDSLESAAASAILFFEEDKNLSYDRKVRQIVPTLVPMVKLQHDQAMASWPQVTDCDRLDAAFEDLNVQGIMARHHWTCCGNCGAAQMYDEFARVKRHRAGAPITGYAFYHIQDTESAADGGGLYLSYGACNEKISDEEYERLSLQTARLVCDVLKKHALRVDWNGEYSKRIAVQLNWQRRTFPPRFCEFATYPIVPSLPPLQSKPWWKVW